MFKRASPLDECIVAYFDACNNKYIAKGGSLAWRLNNPGLLHTRDRNVCKQGIIGVQFPYVIFESAHVGISALQAWLKSPKFFNATLVAIAKYYQPQSSEECLQTLCDITGLLPNSKVGTLSCDEFRRLIKAILTLCHFSSSYEGEILCLPKISALYFSAQRNIEYYLIDFKEMLTRKEVISRIEAHCLDAVIIHKNDGSVYVRSRPGHRIGTVHLSEKECVSDNIQLEKAIREIGEKKKGQCLWAYINGIWNDEAKAQESIELISEIAEGEHVLSLVNNTKGYASDLIDCFRQKSKYLTDVVKLAICFFQLLVRLAEGEADTPPIILFAHSQGAIITDLALENLKPNIREKIRVFTFGGGSFIFPGKAHPESHNYISFGDMVPRVASPIRSPSSH